MPRSAAGVYTLPAGNPVVTNTLITSTWANDTMPDLGSEITNSLDRSGRGGMLAPIKGVDGSAALPLFSFTNEPSSGIYRSAAGVLNVSILGASIGSFQATGWNGSIVGHASLDLPLTGGTLTGNLAVTGSTNAGVGYTATNASAGTAASSSLTVTNDGAVSSIFGMTSSGYTSLAVIGASSGFMYGSGVGGLAIVANAGTLRFAAGGSTEMMRIATDGRVGIGAAASIGASKLEVTAPDDARIVLNGSGAAVGSGGNLLFYRTSSYVGRIGVSANSLGDSSANLMIASNAHTVFCANGVTEMARLDTAGRFMVNTTTAGVSANASCWMTVGGNTATAYSSVKTASGTEELLMGASAGLTHIGSFSNTAFQLRANNVPTLILTAAGLITDAAGNELGFKQFPVSSEASGVITRALSLGKMIRASGNITWNSTSGWTLGDTVLIYNNTGGNISILVGGAASLSLSGTALTGTRTLASNGFCTIIHVGGATQGNCSGPGTT